MTISMQESGQRNQTTSCPYPTRPWAHSKPNVASTGVPLEERALMAMQVTYFQSYKLEVFGMVIVLICVF